MNRNELILEIMNNCDVLYKRTEVIRFANADDCFRHGFWKIKIDEIKEAGLKTETISELMDLKERSRLVSIELEEFCKRLI